MNVEEIKELIAAIEPMVTDLSNAAILIVVVYIIFQLLMGLVIPTIWAWFGFHIVNKLHDYFRAEKVEKIIENKTIKKVEIKLDGEIISNEDCYSMIRQAFDVARNRAKYKSDYLHKDDCQWLLDAVMEKAQREKEKTND